MIPAPLYKDPIYNGAADPMVIRKESDGKYYMFYTQRRANQQVEHVSYCYGSMIGVAESLNGRDWHYRGALDLDFEFGHNTFWAPEIIYHPEDATYHMYVSYIQGVYMQLFQKELFTEDCVAWMHGPVYKDVYEVFRNFKYNPIEDNRFSLLQNRFRELSQEEKIAIELVVDSFGMYSGKVLEKITHTETPWQEARAYCLPQGRSNVVISKEAIRDYFSKVAEQFPINSVEGLRDYIDSRLNDV